jgi:hypothetical protein
MKTLYATVAAAISILALACGAVANPTDSAGDASVPADALAAADGPSTRDAPAPSDTGAPNVADAATNVCAARGTGAACTSCCTDQASGWGGFALFFDDCCSACGSDCLGTALCQPTSADAGPLAGACLECLDLKLHPNGCGQWDACQGQPVCKAYVACITSCPP